MAPSATPTGRRITTRCVRRRTARLRAREWRSAQRQLLFVLTCSQWRNAHQAESRIRCSASTEHTHVHTEWLNEILHVHPCACTHGNIFAHQHTYTGHTHTHTHTHMNTHAHHTHEHTNTHTHTRTHTHTHTHTHAHTHTPDSAFAFAAGISCTRRRCGWTTRAPGCSRHGRSIVAIAIRCRMLSGMPR
jgi:hypothetical protein